jgi:hypothetical protein
MLIFFVVTTLVTLGLLIGMLKRTVPAVVYVLPLWLAATGLAAAEGWLAFGPLPPRVMLLIVASTLLTVFIAFSSVGARIADAVPLWQLIGFQAFRISVEIFLAWGYHDGIVPVQMTMEGRNFDVLTGLSACLVSYLLMRGVAGKRVALAWNLAGLALLINIVAIAALSMPTPLRKFMSEPSSAFVSLAPYLWLPTFLVQAALFGHLAVFRKLSRRSAETRRP